MVESLKKSGITHIEAWGIQPNPVISKVKEIINLAKKAKVQALLAVGGGSVIDSAKAVACGYYMDDVWQAFEARETITKALPLFTIPTLSGTGTETNPYAVVTNESQHKKWNISGPALYPKVSILDPAIQMSLPWNQTANGAIDAISHILEYYFMSSESETTLALDESLIRTIIGCVDTLKKSPNDYNARANLAWSATLALNGISGAGMEGGDWACHGIEHAISALNPGIAHGAGLAVVFPKWISYCQKENPALFLRWARNIFSCKSVEDGVAAMREKYHSWKAPTTIDELGIDKSQISAIADNTIDFGLTGSLKSLKKMDIIAILS